MPARERADLFAETAERRVLPEAIIEKDFWVCWMLKQLFSIEAFSGRLLFKGGTSLSKIFHAINRATQAEFPEKTLISKTFLTAAFGTVCLLPFLSLRADRANNDPNWVAVSNKYANMLISIEMEHNPEVEGRIACAPI